jgi:hypothetical protein
MTACSTQKNSRAGKDNSLLVIFIGVATSNFIRSVVIWEVCPTSNYFFVMTLINRADRLKQQLMSLTRQNNSSIHFNMTKAAGRAWESFTSRINLPPKQ